MKESLPGEGSGRTALLTSAIMSIRLRRVTRDRAFHFSWWLSTVWGALSWNSIVGSLGEVSLLFLQEFLSADFAKMHWMAKHPLVQAIWHWVFKTFILKTQTPKFKKAEQHGIYWREHSLGQLTLDETQFWYCDSLGKQSRPDLVSSSQEKIATAYVM